MKTKTLEKYAELLNVLGHPIRLAIIQALRKEMKCVSDIQELLDTSQPNLSRHLLQLRQMGIIDCCRKGQYRCYYIRQPEKIECLFEFLSGKYPEKSPEELANA